MSFVSFNEIKPKFFDFQDLSEKEKPFIVTNEMGTEPILSFLKKCSEERDPQRLHMGFSGWYNFNIVKATGAEYIIIGDVNKNTSVLYDATEETLRNSPDRFEFINKIV